MDLISPLFLSLDIPHLMISESESRDLHPISITPISTHATPLPLLSKKLLKKHEL
jgi:hypothetical protein